MTKLPTCFHLQHIIWLFLSVCVWLLFSIGLIEYFNWYTQFMPGLLLHSGIFIICISCGLIANRGNEKFSLAKTFGMNRTNFTFYCLAFVFALIVWLADYWFQVWMMDKNVLQDAQQLQQELKQFGVLELGLSICFLAPLAEEVLFRGIILNGLMSRLSGLWAIMISSGLFTAIHFSLTDSLTLFIAAVGYCMLTLKSKSILPGLFAHVLNNSTTVLYLISF